MARAPKQTSEDSPIESVEPAAATAVSSSPEFTPGSAPGSLVETMTAALDAAGQSRDIATYTAPGEPSSPTTLVGNLAAAEATREEVQEVDPDETPAVQAAFVSGTVVSGVVG